MDDLDSMFNSMLGELDMISQTLEDQSNLNEKISPKYEKQKDIDPSPPPPDLKLTTISAEEDVDLSAMLDDLTNFEHALTAGAGQMKNNQSSSQDSGIGFNGNSLPRNLTPTRFDDAPQVNTLKRHGDHSAVSYGMDHGSIEDLDRDIEAEKRAQKHQQLTQEELDSLSPDLSELDSLVTELSTMSFNHAALQEQNTPTGPPSPVPTPKQSNNDQSNKSNHSTPPKPLEKLNHMNGDIVNNSHIPPPVSSKPKLPAVPQKPAVAVKPSKVQVVDSSSSPPKSLKKGPPALPQKPKPKIDVPRRGGSVKASQSSIADVLSRQFQQQNQGDNIRLKSDENMLHSESRPHANTISHSGDIRDSLTVNMAQTTLERQMSSSQSSIRSNISQGSVRSTISQSSIRSATSLSSIRSNGSRRSNISTGSSDSSSEVEHKPQPLNARYSFVPSEVLQKLEAVRDQANAENLSPEEREERIKAEKMRLALEKLKEARITKLVVKVYNKDESTKTLMVDERMTTRNVVTQLLDKNHFDPSPNWALIEELPSLFMERMFEEHEVTTEMLCYWTRDSTNRVRFLERKDKYALFRNPQHYLLTQSETEGQMAERQKQTLIDEFFSGKGAGSGVPEVEGTLWVKGDSKSWSQKYCVLRQSGLYMSKNGEPKKGKRVTNLTCLVMFEQMCIYLGRGWRKKFKSPTDYGFALKHPAIQSKSKHIKYFSCPDVRSLMRWIVGMRIAKYGKALKDNYDKTLEEVRMLTSSTAGFFKGPQAPDSASIKSSDSDNASMGGTMPRAGGVKNVFEGAWQRAQQQEDAENSEVSNSATPSRQKSVWQGNKGRSQNNWWDLQEEEKPPLSPLKSNRLSSSSSGSRSSYKGSNASTPSKVPPPPVGSNGPPPPPSKPKPYANNMVDQAMPPPPPMNGSAPSKVRHMSPPSSYNMPPQSGYNRPPAPPRHDMPPPPENDMPLPPPMDNDMPPPPSTGYMPPPPDMGNMPPPPGMGNMPPPPAMGDMPPPPPMGSMPPMDNMPPPPPMEDLPPPPMNSGNSHLPPALRNTKGGMAPIRLPMIPVKPKQFGGPLPPSPRNYNHNNNTPPPLLPRESFEESPPNFHPPTPSKEELPPMPPVKPHKPQVINSGLQPPLSVYYNTSSSVNYKMSDFPPPPEFVLDLKYKFQSVQSNCSNNSNFDLPPPPPDVILSQTKKPIRHNSRGSNVPPPPRRNPTTRLSSRRR